MEDNYDEIAALFEEELRDLDFNDSGDDEYDESLAQIDALGAQLRQTLHGQEDEVHTHVDHARQPTDPQR